MYNSLTFDSSERRLFTPTNLILALLFFTAAMLYASVGHAGASGYLAIMSLFGMAPAEMRPTALVLNILVATIATVKFYRAGNFSRRVFLPFAVGSIPFAFIGGGLALPVQIYKPIVGLALLYSAIRLLQSTRANDNAAEYKPVPVSVGVSVGVAIGLLSGLTGVGGGIFLSPLMVLMRWADARHTAGVSAAFILVNSIAGLLGNLAAVGNLPASLPLLAVAVAVGGYFGAEYGSKRLSNATIKRFLALVLVIGGLKMIVEGL
jgi:hypothetical protein